MTLVNLMKNLLSMTLSIQNWAAKNPIGTNPQLEVCKVGMMTFYGG